MTDQPPAATTGPMFHEIRAMPPERAYPYRRLTWKTYAVYILVGLNALTQVATIVALAMRWSVLSQVGRAGASEALVQAATFSDRFVAIAAVLSLITLVLSYIAGGMWIYSAATNVRALGARGLETSPGWAVGWYFIPVMSLFRPFQAMREISQASRSPGAWRGQSTPALLGWWWAVWLIAGYSGEIIALTARNLTSVPGLIAATTWQIADTAVDLAALALFVLVVRAIYQAQVQAEGGTVAQVFA